jgi:alpha-1,6-mannosyltransferase
LKLKQIILIISYAIIYLLGVFILNFSATQSNFSLILLGYSMAFLAYGFYYNIYETIEDSSLIVILFLAIGLCIPSWPKLSDDVYRFLWDGYLSKIGENPYGVTPEQFLAMQNDVYLQGIYPELNSPYYYTVYPFTSQIIFLLAAFFNKIAISVMVMKIIYAALHLLGFYYARKWCRLTNVNEKVLWLYMLNPLVLIEGIGNLHAEIIMVAFFSMAMYYYQLQKWFLSALGYSLACATKLLPLFLLPYFLYRSYSNREYKFILCTLVLLFILFCPILLSLSHGGFLNSINLYFQKFEFNASVYYLLRWLGKLLSGYNLILYLGPLLFIAFLHYLWRFCKRENSYKSYLFFSTKNAAAIYILYLFCSTTVHPWYVVFPLFLSIVSGMISVMAWSYLIVLTYINYSYRPYHENLWMVGLEYGVLLLLLWRSGEGITLFRAINNKNCPS